MTLRELLEKIGDLQHHIAMDAEVAISYTYETHEHGAPGVYTKYVLVSDVQTIELNQYMYEAASTDRTGVKWYVVIR